MGLGAALCLPGRISGGGFTGRALLLQPGRLVGLYPLGPPVHLQPLPKGSNQQVRAPRGGLHPQPEARYVSSSSGCYSYLKIAWAVQPSIPFFQESEKRCSRPTKCSRLVGVLFVRKALWYPPGARM